MEISDKIIDRLTLYHCIFTDYSEKKIEYISSPQIANLLKIDDSQVRKDLKYLNNIGKCRVGYNVLELKQSIERTLGFEVRKGAFIVGAGHLGLALSKYDNFLSYGLDIKALFDINPEKINTQIGEKKVFNLNDLPKMAKEMNVEMAILTVPRTSAQNVTDFLVASGINNIWNFAPCILRVPENTKVWNENLMSSCLQFRAHTQNEKKISKQEECKMK